MWQCGVTAIAAMGGRGRATGHHWLTVATPGGGGILTPLSSASMVTRTNGARRVGGGASLMGMSVSPAVSTLGRLCGGEGKLNLKLLRADDDTSGEGGYVLGVDCDNH